MGQLFSAPCLRKYQRKKLQENFSNSIFSKTLRSFAKLARDPITDRCYYYHSPHTCSCSMRIAVNKNMHQQIALHTSGGLLGTHGTLIPMLSSMNLIVIRGAILPSMIVIVIPRGGYWDGEG